MTPGRPKGSGRRTAMAAGLLGLLLVVPAGLSGAGASQQWRDGESEGHACSDLVLPDLPAPDDATFDAPRHVPHGTIELLLYRNHEGADKHMRVYLPPGYETEQGTRYPVLFLTHDDAGDDASWTAPGADGGAAQIIFDNLIAAGLARPMIVVMPDMRACETGLPERGVEDACAREFAKDLVPLIDQRYRTVGRREGRAIAGPVMGGFLTLRAGLPELDTFGELYVFGLGPAAAVDRERLAEVFGPVLGRGKTHERLAVPLYFATGTTPGADAAELVADLAIDAGAPVFPIQRAGTGWAAWRRALYQAAQVMFPDCAGR